MCVIIWSHVCMESYYIIQLGYLTYTVNCFCRYCTQTSQLCCVHPLALAKRLFSSWPSFAWCYNTGMLPLPISRSSTVSLHYLLEDLVFVYFSNVCNINLFAKYLWSPIIIDVTFPPLYLSLDLWYCHMFCLSLLMWSIVAELSLHPALLMWSANTYHIRPNLRTYPN